MSLNSWLVRQRELVEEAIVLITSYKLDAWVTEDRNRPVVRLKLGPERFIDLKIKATRTRFARSYWIAPVQQVTSTIDWLIYCNNEKVWFYISGKEIIKIDHQEISEWNGKPYYVVSGDDVHSFKNILKKLVDLKERKTQRRMPDFC